MSKERRERQERRPVARHRAMWAYPDLEADERSALVVVDCDWEAFVVDNDAVVMNGLTKCPTCDAFVPISSR